MKHLGRIEIGGSLDITNNKHVEELLEEALKGIEFPEDTNTTYTLTQDGLVVQLVDDSGQTVSTIELPEFEDTNTTYTLTRDGTTIQLEGSEGGASEVDLVPLIPQPVDPYQEVKDIDLHQMPPANLFSMIRNNEYDDFDFTTDLDAENNLISIYLHLYSNDIVRTFTLANNVSNQQWPIYEKNNNSVSYNNIVDIIKAGSKRTNVSIKMHNGGNKLLVGAEIHITDDLEPDHTELDHSDGIVIINRSRSRYFIFPDVNEETLADQQVITGTLEEHLQNIYGYIYNS